MEGLTYSRITLVLSFVLSWQFASGFYTQKCNHDQLETQLKATLNCIMKSQNKNMGSFLTLNKTQMAQYVENPADQSEEWCELIDEEISCFTDNLGTCFDQKLNEDFATILEWYYNKQPYMECNRLEGLTRDEISQKAFIIMGNYKKDIENLKSIVTFDKECTTDQLAQSVQEKIPCFQSHFFGLMAELMTSTEHNSFPVCNAITGIFGSCFDSNSCFSQQEMNLVRDFFATYYKVTMTFVVQLSDKFGSMSKFMEAAGIGKNDMNDAKLPTQMGFKMKDLMKAQMKDLMMNVTNLIVEDYKTETCQTNLQQFSMMVDPGLIQQLPLKDKTEDGDKTESYMVVTALVLSLVVIMLVAILGWVFYAYRNPTSRSGQVLIRVKSGRQGLFRSGSTGLA